MLIKKILFLFTLSFVMLISHINCSCADISASKAVVINADTKEILYEKNAHKKASMASTTKMLTSIIAIESGKLDGEVTATAECLSEGSSIGLKDGYKLSLKDLVYGMLLESGNDAANLCAIYLGNNFDGFANIMNKKAKEIGMTNSNFVTPSGLDADSHYSTAYDMALLGAYCIDNPIFREICSKKDYDITLIEPKINLNFYNHNKLLTSCEGVFGIKTGFTRKSGRCLVSACERDGATLVCATLNAPDDWNDHKTLYDSVFAELNKSTISFCEINEINVYGGQKQKIKVECKDFAYHFKENDDIYIKASIPPIIYAPIGKGEIIGKVQYLTNKGTIHTSYIYSCEDVSLGEETYKEKISIFERIKNFFKKERI